MENIIITLIQYFFICCLVTQLLQIVDKYGQLLITNNIGKEELKTLSNEIATLTSLHMENKQAIKHIVKRLPFIGEEWQQKFINEALKEVEESGYYERVDNILNNNEEN